MASKDYWIDLEELSQLGRELAEENFDPDLQGVDIRSFERLQPDEKVSIDNKDRPTEDEIDIKKIGPKIENYRFFPERINVTFAQVLDKNNIKVNVWERGAGQTKACGTAACAVAVSASIKGLTDKNLEIHFKEGNLKINYKEEIFMAGSVSDVKKINLDI